MKAATRVPARARRSRELTLAPEQAFALATERHRLGELDDAELVYRTLLKRWPDHADVLSQLGVLEHQRGRHDEALALLRRALERAPERSGIWNNLGTVLLRLKQVDEAERAFHRSIQLVDNPQAQANLSRVLRRRKAWAESEAACRRAITLAPEFGDGWHNLSLTLIEQNRIAEGVQAASRALTLLPPHKRRRDSYARALVLLGQHAEAAALYREWLADEPGNAYVQHHLAACTEGAAPPRASDAYVELVFDDFAASFDAKLASLNYRAPQLVADALGRAVPSPQRRFDIADLGCGTGLCGPLVAPWARRLWGCDLSGAMLALARERAVYDVLEKAELVCFLDDHPAAFDVLISADTLCYFGDLRAVGIGARRALRASGCLVFTVEALEEGDAADHRLRPNGRFAHARSHLVSMLAVAGLHCERIDAVALRDEGGRAVQGWLVTARAPG
jgi:predicted TPR repeat methyltransferase